MYQTVCVCVFGSTDWGNGVDQGEDFSVSCYTESPGEEERSHDVSPVIENVSLDQIVIVYKTDIVRARQQVYDLYVQGYQHKVRVVLITCLVIEEPYFYPS